MDGFREQVDKKQAMVNREIQPPLRRDIELGP